MKESSPSSPASTEVEVLNFLSEFSRHLLAAGISYEKFNGLSKRAYVQAASLEARFSNSKINKSAIAAMTGLTRTEVRAVVKGIQQRKELASDRIERLITSWLTDPAFTSHAKQPKRLLLRGMRSSFPQLAKKYGADIPTKALLRELQRQGIVEIQGDYVVLTESARRLPSQRQLRSLSLAFSRSLKTTRDKGVGVQGVKILSADASYPELSKVGQSLLKRRVEEALKIFAREIETVGESIAHDLDKNPNRGNDKSTTVVMVTIS